MDELAARALDTARLRGACYADVRVIELATQSLSVRNGVVDGLASAESAGLGVRVLVDGAWGFAASHDLSAAAAERTAALAVQIARASALSNTARVNLGPPLPSRGAYTTPLAVDPFTISVEDKLGLLLAAEAAMARVPGARLRHGNLGFQREHKRFASSEGADLAQTLYEAGGGLTVLAVDADEVQRRSYPTPFRQQGAAGWEYVLALDLPGQAERVAEEAVALLRADECPAGLVTTVIIGSEQLALQIHEFVRAPGRAGSRLWG